MDFTFSTKLFPFPLITHTHPLIDFQLFLQLIDVIKVEEEEYKMIQKFEFFA